MRIQMGGEPAWYADNVVIFLPFLPFWTQWLKMKKYPPVDDFYFLSNEETGNASNKGR